MTTERDILHEVLPARQIAGEARRRWFYSPSCDLVVWVNDDDSIAGFQFCYDKQDAQHSLTWKPDDGFIHAAVDTGETHPLHPKATPLLAGKGAFDVARIESLFTRAAAQVPSEYVQCVVAKMREFAEVAPAERAPAP